MMPKLVVFVSSVQKELEDERLIVQNLINTDSFLASHCTPLLFEFEPAAPDKASEACLAALDGCDAYLLIVGRQYGARAGTVSITHAEYRRAKQRKLPILAFIRGERSVEREAGTLALLDELERDGFKYKRFENVVALQREVRAALVKLLKERFGIAPTSDENAVAEQTIAATSPFESQPSMRLRWRDLDHALARQLLGAIVLPGPPLRPKERILAAATQHGLAWQDPATGEHFATAAGIVMLARDPSAVFPQCRIMADAFRGAEADGKPRDQEDIREPLPRAIERALAFVDRNTRHPMRVVGLNRLRLDEYPAEALREVLVNAAAHRDYGLAGQMIMLEVFADRIVVSSPGLPPAPLTLASLRKGKYRPCSRNPVLAQSLASVQRIEQRGSGFRRMRDAMLDHGLEQPLLGTNTGYFQVTLPGPGEDVERIRVPVDRLRVTPAIEARLSERQKAMLAVLVQGEALTSRACETRFGVTRETANQDFAVLMELGLAIREGKGRSTRYVLGEGG